MKIKTLSQLEFPAVLYDSLFALILFFGFDSFLDITSAEHFALYVLANFVVIHWWLLFKAADDTFERGVRESAIGILVNLAVIMILDIILLNASAFRYEYVALMIAVLLSVDMLWISFVFCFEKWKKFPRETVKVMKNELRTILREDIIVLVPIVGLLIGGKFLSASIYIGLLIILYLAYLVITFRDKIIDIPIY